MLTDCQHIQMTLNIWWVYQPKSHRKPNLFQMVQMKRCEWKHYWERSGLRQYLKTSTSRTSYRAERQREEIQSRGPVEIWRSCSVGERDSSDKHHPGRKQIGKNAQLFFHPALWLPDRVSQQLHPSESQPGRDPGWCSPMIGLSATGEGSQGWKMEMGE